MVLMSLNRSQLPLQKEASILAAFKRDSNWFNSHERELEKKYKGEYVAVKDEKLIDHDSDFPALLKRLRKKGVKTENLFMDFVGDRKLILNLSQRYGPYVVSYGKEGPLGLAAVDDFMKKVRRQGASEAQEAVTGVPGRYTYTKAGRDYISETKSK